MKRCIRCIETCQDISRDVLDDVPDVSKGIRIILGVLQLYYVSSGLLSECIGQQYICWTAKHVMDNNKCILCILMYLLTLFIPNHPPMN